jgi:hypothetical protein
MISHSAPAWAARPSAWPTDDATMVATLASTLLAIRQRRGALFMLDSSRWLIEKWNLASDCLDEQSEETIRLVERLLKS